MVWLTALSTGSLNRIFQAVLGGFLQAIVPALNDLTEPLVAASVKIYERIASELLPTPAKSHYTFNLRDLSKVSSFASSALLSCVSPTNDRRKSRHACACISIRTRRNRPHSMSKGAEAERCRGREYSPAEPRKAGIRSLFLAFG